ncbi:SPOR domain-containing protein [Magnetofaba australis]|uniref:Putative Sporulation domain protein n=1 Tax=Magnetofaba australis IT-1 TaxID=1434232 RepID=A0A1Y2K9A4_9PROT|nr:SPOR domain-containing protein [Magnetofaba australis]OSM07199.1 putative Sporulation domain protein [Magnetofaba australis IT-1]
MVTVAAALLGVALLWMSLGGDDPQHEAQAQADGVMQAQREPGEAQALTSRQVTVPLDIAARSGGVAKPAEGGLTAGVSRPNVAPKHVQKSAPRSEASLSPSPDSAPLDGVSQREEETVADLQPDVEMRFYTELAKKHVVIPVEAVNTPSMGAAVSRVSHRARSVGDKQAVSSVSVAKAPKRVFRTDLAKAAPKPANAATPASERVWNPKKEQVAKRAQVAHRPNLANWNPSQAIDALMAKRAARDDSFILQVASLSKQQEANALASRLQGRGAPARVAVGQIDGRPIYRVRIGPFPSRDAAMAAASRYRVNGAKVFANKG